MVIWEIQRSEWTNTTDKLSYGHVDAMPRLMTGWPRTIYVQLDYIVFGGLVTSWYQMSQTRISIVFPCWK